MAMEYKLKTFNNARTVRVCGVIDNDSLSTFKNDIANIVRDDDAVIAENIENLRNFDERLCERYKETMILPPPIVLDITTHGGLCLEGLAFYDILRSMNDEGTHPVICEMSGCIASMGTFIVLGCDVRKIHKNTSVCVHSVNGGAIGKIMEIKEDYEEVKRISDLLHEIYYKHTNITREQIEEIDRTKRDWWFNAEEALKMGIATEII